MTDITTDTQTATTEGSKPRSTIGDSTETEISPSVNMVRIYFYFRPAWCNIENLPFYSKIANLTCWHFRLFITMERINWTEFGLLSSWLVLRHILVIFIDGQFLNLTAILMAIPHRTTLVKLICHYSENFNLFPCRYCKITQKVIWAQYGNVSNELFS